MRISNILSRLGLASSAVLSFLATSSHAQDVTVIPTSTNTSTTAASVFITPTRDLAFALNVPDDNSTTQDLFFTLLLPTDVSWGAIGLGSAHMASSLMLIAYPSASGQNVTLSPRIATGHSEPVFAPDIRIEALPGTGLDNGTTYVFNGRCANCRRWSAGKVDVESAAQPMVYATGEAGGRLKSDAPDAPLRMHYSYGSFTLDMRRATGAAGVPAIDRSQDSALVGAVQGFAKEGKKDSVAVAHAVVMVLVFVGMYPFGMFVLRLGNWVRWHGINQGVALVFTIIGSGLGFDVSKIYNRVSCAPCYMRNLDQVEEGGGGVVLRSFGMLTRPSIVQEIQHRPPGYRHPHLHFHLRPVRTGIPAPSQLQEVAADD